MNPNFLSLSLRQFMIDRPHIIFSRMALRVLHRAAGTAVLLIAMCLNIQAQLAFSYDPSGNLTNIATASAIAPSSFTSSEVITLFVGDRLSLTAVHSGKPPFTYQWRKNGSNITGATKNTLSI